MYEGIGLMERLAIQNLKKLERDRKNTAFKSSYSPKWKHKGRKSLTVFFLREENSSFENKRNIRKKKKKGLWQTFKRSIWTSENLTYGKYQMKEQSCRITCCVESWKGGWSTKGLTQQHTLSSMIGGYSLTTSLHITTPLHPAVGLCLFWALVGFCFYLFVAFFLIFSYLEIEDWYPEMPYIVQSTNRCTVWEV